MKKLFILLLLSVTIINCNAQLLWKVSGGNTHKPSYLFGTIHLETGEYIDSVPGLNDAIESVDAIYGEILADSLLSNDAMMKIMKDSAAPADSTIDKLISKEDYALVDSVVRSYMLGLIGLDQLKKLKPAIVYTQLNVQQMQKHFPKMLQATNILDISIQKRGMAAGKHVDGLETIEAQTSALFDTPITEQAQDLVDFCRKDKEFERYSKLLSDAYHAQDMKAIEDIVFDPQMGMSKSDMERIGYSRNRNWMDKITMTLPVQSVLVAVGAAHLVGEQGLINLLRQKGYTVEPAPRK